MSPDNMTSRQHSPPSGEIGPSRELNATAEVILVSLGKNLDAIDLEGEHLEITRELRQLLNEIRTILNGAFGPSVSFPPMSAITGERLLSGDDASL